MMYKNNIDFAIRTILLEKKLREQYPDYQFTIAAGAVLNALSAIKPDKTFLVELTEVLGLRGKEMEDFLTTLRDGLAHKSEKNFAANPCDENQIVSIKIAHHGGENERTLSIADFHSILLALEQAFEKNCENLYNEQKANIEQLRQ